MRPTRHTDPSEDGLIAHIKGSLMEHEEAYTPGAWERFAEKEKKPRGLIFWIGGLSSAAALLLLGIGIYFYTTPDTGLQQHNQQVKTPFSPVPPAGNAIPEKENPLPGQPSASPGKLQKNIFIAERRATSQGTPENQPAIAITPSSVLAEGSAKTSPSTPEKIQPPKETKKRHFTGFSEQRKPACGNKP